MKDPTAAAQKWSQNLARSGPSIQAGVQAVTVSPTQKAAQSLDKARQNYDEAITSGRMAAALNNVSLSEWQQAMLTTGLSRIASGAQKGQGNYQKFATKFYPVADAVSKQAAQMPNNSTEDAMAKVRLAIVAFKQFAGKPA